MIKQVFIFGFGYTASFFSKLLIDNNYQVCGSSRKEDIRQNARNDGITLCDFDDNAVKQLLDESQAVLVCIPPNENGTDPVLSKFKELLVSNKNIKWFGYLSTTGVYGDHDGKWVTEESNFLNPGDRALRRIRAENEWMSLYKDYNFPVHIFRLAGIYGVGRSSLDKLQAGKSYSIVKPGQFFSRIHVEDISRILLASIQKPTPGEIYNICDDYPSAPQEVDKYAANLLGVEEPRAVKFEDAELTPMALEFYKSNRRVSNAKVKKALSLDLLYPSYKEGLESIWKDKS